MAGDTYPTSGYFECERCAERLISEEHFNACPTCGNLMESVL